MKIQNDSQQDEEALVMAASKGDLDAFNQLVLTYQDLAYQQAYWLLGDPASAEDVTQDSFIKAFQGLNGFHGGSFRAWLMRIVTNTVYDLLRRSSRRPSQPLFPEDGDGEEMESLIWLADPNASVEGMIEQREHVRFIYSKVNELQDAYRSVITLVDLQDFDYEEAAQALNIPIGTVKSRLARARLQMKQMLDGKVSGGRSVPASTAAV